MEATSSKERLLNGYEEDLPIELPYTKKPRSNLRIIFTWVAVLGLLLSNVFLFVNNHQLRHKRTEEVLGLSQYAGLTYDTPTIYQNKTEYWGDNTTLSDELWANIDTSAMEVALSDDYVKANDLPDSIFRFPWDETKGIYYLKVFHSLHCLKAMHKAYSDLERGNPQQVKPWHVYHCFDALRQDIMCNADDTPMAMTDFPNKVGNHQVRMCRNWDQLVSWTQENERNACYRRFTDYHGVKNIIEMYAYCPEDSPYYAQSQAYFEQHGHKPLFGGDGEELKD